MAITDFTVIVPGVLYFPGFLSRDAADDALADVREQVDFVQRKRRLYGRTFATPRLEAWHGPAPYRFGGSELPARELPPILASLAIRAEIVADAVGVRASLPTCLANLYRDGMDSVAEHSDDEPEMGDPIIASISLGAARDFLLRRKPEARSSARADRLAGAPWATPDNVSVRLEHGSLLLMLRGVQAEYRHALPKRPGVLEPRVNLTFRDCSPVQGAQTPA